MCFKLLLAPEHDHYIRILLNFASSFFPFSNFIIYYNTISAHLVHRRSDQPSSVPITGGDNRPEHGRLPDKHRLHRLRHPADRFPDHRLVLAGIHLNRHVWLENFCWNSKFYAPTSKLFPVPHPLVGNIWHSAQYQCRLQWANFVYDQVKIKCFYIK